MPPSLNTHTIHLHTSRLHLRPMTDADWDTLLRWNQDPDVLYYADGSDVTAYTLDQIKRHLRRYLASPPSALSPNSTASPLPRLGCRT